MFEPEFPHVLDSSIMAQFKQCPQLCYKQYFDEWKSKEPSVHLHAGGAFARGVEVVRRAYYEGVAIIGQGDLTPDDRGQPVWTVKWEQYDCPSHDAKLSLEVGMGALLAFYGPFDCPEDSAKSATRMAGALEFYFNNYPLEKDGEPFVLASGKPAIEVSFAEPLDVKHPETGDPLIYSGRLDAGLCILGGRFMVDEKTTSSLGPTWSRQWDLRSQFTGYAWGLERIGIPVDGIVVRGVSILKTKYDTQEAVSYRPEWQIDRWLNELQGRNGWIEDMLRCWETGVWKHNLDHSCSDFGGCQFRNVCLSTDKQSYLDTYFERRHWDPQTRKETRL